VARRGASGAEDVTGRVPMDRFVDAARAHLEWLSGRVPLETAVLDRWGGAVRLVYGCECVRRCASACDRCELHAAVGEDLAAPAPDEFRSSLRAATARQLETFSARQRMMNCKTLDEYGRAFVEWLVWRCPDRPSLEAELALVSGFRLLVVAGRPATLLEERELRQRIVSDALAHPSMDAGRRATIEELVGE
jgi:hypothetical protein